MERDVILKALINTFGTAVAPRVSDLSAAMYKVVCMCAATYHELASGKRFGEPIADAELDAFVRSWRDDAGKYDGQTKRSAMLYEANILVTQNGWTETVVDGHFAVLSPNRRFIVRYIAIGKTQARSYFERYVETPAPRRMTRVEAVDAVVEIHVEMVDRDDDVIEDMFRKGVKAIPQWSEDELAEFLERAYGAPVEIGPTTKATECPSCNRAEERVGSKLKPITLNADGICGACQNAKDETR